MTQRRKIIDSRDLILLNDVAFSSGKTCIDHNIISGISPIGIHVIDKCVALGEWADCYILLCMNGSFNVPYETHIELRVEDYNSLSWGMEIEG